MSFEQKSQGQFAEVILPLSIRGTYTYGVPVDLHGQLQPGQRVEVPLRNKLYAGIVSKIHDVKPITKFRNVISILDEEPILDSKQIELWEWIADYYCSTIGQTMGVGLPSGLKLSSETRYLFNRDINLSEFTLTSDESLIVDAAEIQSELDLDQVQGILEKQHVRPVILSLLRKGVLVVKEELQTGYKPKKEWLISFSSLHQNDRQSALELCGRSEKQQQAVLGLISLSQGDKEVKKIELQKYTGVSSQVIKSLESKGIVTLTQVDVSRLNKGEWDNGSNPELSEIQVHALNQIETSFETKHPVLLHGVTGSGKTRLYAELINASLAEGGQVLFLLPEIALTTQIVQRLRAWVKGNIHMFHSRINNATKVEVWKAARNESALFIGARSALFLPFDNLKLIVVDEEHDPSYKQDNPSFTRPF